MATPLLRRMVIIFCIESSLSDVSIGPTGRPPSSPVCSAARSARSCASTRAPSFRGKRRLRQRQRLLCRITANQKCASAAAPRHARLKWQRPVLQRRCSPGAQVSTRAAHRAASDATVVVRGILALASMKRWTSACPLTTTTRESMSARADRTSVTRR